MSGFKTLIRTDLENFDRIKQCKMHVKDKNKSGVRIIKIRIKPWRLYQYNRPDFTYCSTDSIQKVDNFNR